MPELAIANGLRTSHFHNGQYYLYYAVSSFGSNNSAIGVATNKTLHPDSPDFKWVDHGPVVESVAGRDLFNAIDPNLAFDDQGTGWLTFGSFWKGMKLVKLDASLTAVAQPEEWTTVAARERYWKLDETRAGDVFNGSIEAPFIFRKNGLVLSIRLLGQVLCRSEQHVQGGGGPIRQNHRPLSGQGGQEMRYGGGSLVVGGNKKWPGVGHNGTYTFDGKDYLVFHGYDASTPQGRSLLWVSEIQWDGDSWPTVSLDK